MQFGAEDIVMILVAVMAITFIMLLFAYRKLSKLNKHLEEMLPTGGGIDELVGQYLTTLTQVQKNQTRFSKRITALEKLTDTSLTKVELTRYNAFSGVGGDQSFSMALLRENGEGVVISGIYGREETRIYAKPIKDGQSPYPLSDEEDKVVKAAIERN